MHQNFFNNRTTEESIYDKIKVKSINRFRHSSTHLQKWSVPIWSMTPCAKFNRDSYVTWFSFFFYSFALIHRLWATYAGKIRNEYGNRFYEHQNWSSNTISLTWSFSSYSQHYSRYIQFSARLICKETRWKINWLHFTTKVIGAFTVRGALVTDRNNIVFRTQKFW